VHLFSELSHLVLMPCLLLVWKLFAHGYLALKGLQMSIECQYFVAKGKRDIWHGAQIITRYIKWPIEGFSF
jgi:hypothetical protein